MRQSRADFAVGFADFGKTGMQIPAIVARFEEATR
jgi:hypothetical protein